MIQKETSFQTTNKLITDIIAKLRNEGLDHKFTIEDAFKATDNCVAANLVQMIIEQETEHIRHLMQIKQYEN